MDEQRFQRGSASQLRRPVEARANGGQFPIGLQRRYVDRAVQGSIATLLALLLLTALAVPPTLGQTLPTTTTNGQSTPDSGGEDESPVDEDAVVDPGEAAPPGSEVQGATGTSKDGSDTAAEVTARGYANAATQTDTQKLEESRADCADPLRPPVSRMLGLGGSVAADERSEWLTIVLVIAAGAAVLALGAFVARRRRTPRGTPAKPRSALESAATVVALLSTVVGLGVQFIPGLGVNEPPPPEASLEVREVHARITRDEYATKTGAEHRPTGPDAQEVGNVVWLEIQLKGYRDKQPRLQYGLYDPAAGGALLPYTAKEVPIRVEDSDVQTLFVPIWIGYPKTERFEAEFRLLDRGRVRQMASTGRMRSSNYRYACSRPR